MSAAEAGLLAAAVAILDDDPDEHDAATAVDMLRAALLFGAARHPTLEATLAPKGDARTAGISA